SPGPDGSRISLVRQIRKDMSPVPDPQFVAQKLIPEEIENYFLFDGERLDNYFQETSGQQIHDAVFNISQLGLLERVIEHLQREQLGSDLEHLERNISGWEKELTGLLISSAPGIIALPAVTATKKLIDQTEEAGEIPPAYRQSFLERLLREKECICGTELKKG